MKPKLPLLLLRAGLIAVSAATLHTSAHAGVSDTQDFDDRYDYYEYDDDDYDSDDTETSNYPDVQLNPTTYTSTSTGENSGMTLTTTTTIDSSGVSSTVEVTNEPVDSGTTTNEPPTYSMDFSDPYRVGDQLVVTVWCTGSDGYECNTTYVLGTDGDYYQVDMNSPTNWTSVTPVEGSGGFKDSPPPPPNLGPE